MKPLRLATLALLMGAFTSCAAYSQAPGYGPGPGSQPGYGYDDPYARYEGPSPRVEVGFFYDELSPYGDWVRTRDYGWAWFPRDMHPEWRPYSDGRWINSDYGWTWASYEPFGWATYHYGRWTWDPRFGWLWVPGTVWGPAWVSWQYGGGYVGWAPLPPQVGFEIGIGIRLGGFDLRLGIRPDHYRFVPERSFLEPRLSRHLVPTARNITIINNTTNITNYTYINNRVVNRGVEVRHIEKATGKRVRSLRVADSREKSRVEVAETEVRIYRPEKQKLDSVRVGPGANAGRRAETQPVEVTRQKDRPETKDRGEPEIVVAPRVSRAPKPDARQLEQQERREKQELERYLAEEKRKVEKIHQQEAAQTRAKAERDQVVKRHQAEREELQQEQRQAAQQLEARQRAKRKAALAGQPDPAAEQRAKKADDDPKGKNKADDGKQDPKKAKESQEKDKGRGHDKSAEAPPPSRN